MLDVVYAFKLKAVLCISEYTVANNFWIAIFLGTIAIVSMIRLLQMAKIPSTSTATSELDLQLELERI